MKYVAGFLFDSKREKVALIFKLRGPRPVRQRWNAIGGKRELLEDGTWENAHVAMQREFREETGVDVGVDLWNHFMTLNGTDWEVDFFEAADDELLTQVRTMEEEEVRWWRMDKLPNLVPNVRWILPMAIGHNDENVHQYEVTEKVPFAA